MRGAGSQTLLNKKEGIFMLINGNLNKKVKALLPSSTPERATKRRVQDFWEMLPEDVSTFCCDHRWCNNCIWVTVCNGSCAAV